MQFKNLAVGVHCLPIYTLAKRSDFKSSGLDRNLTYISLFV